MLEGISHPLKRESFPYYEANFSTLNHFYQALFCRGDSIMVIHLMGTKPKTDERFVRGKNLVVVKFHDISACDPVDNEATKVGQRLPIGAGKNLPAHGLENNLRSLAIC